MKVKVNEKEKSEFPKLMISDLGQIILAYSESEDGKLLSGVLLVSNGYSIGRCYSETWAAHLFKDFNGSVEISN
jgi:hypothetical protein